MLTQNEVSRIGDVLERAALNNCRSCTINLDRADNTGAITARWSTITHPAITILVYDPRGVLVLNREFDNMGDVVEYFRPLPESGD